MQDVWPYVIAAYAVTGAGLAALVAYRVLSLMYWAKRAREDAKR